MPNREKGEPLNKFIGRYMRSKEARKSFPNAKQRVAVAYSTAEKRK
jgi:hypothetical protein